MSGGGEESLGEGKGPSGQMQSWQADSLLGAKERTSSRCLVGLLGGIVGLVSCVFALVQLVGKLLGFGVGLKAYNSQSTNLLN